MSGKTVAIVQSCYIPWKGYFDLIKEADEFVLFDDRQFTRRDWRNRNRIKTPQGLRWLTVPVEVKGKYLQRIDETRVSDDGWAEKHWRTLEHVYASAPFFPEYRRRFASLYESLDDERLSVINRRLIEEVCDVLGIDTKLSWSTDYDVEGDRTQRLVELCQATGADAYLSGPRARAYLDEQLFAAAGIAVHYFDYDGYAEYPQLHPPFAHEVTALDLIFNTGPSAPQFLKSYSPAMPRG